MITQEINTHQESKLDELLEKRWSPRSFADETLPRQTIIDMFEAGAKVASSFNEQPWRLIITLKAEESYKKLYDCLVDFNQQWVDSAPYLGVVLAKKTFSNGDKEGKPNKHYKYDSGAFMAASSLKAAEKNVYVHQMAGFSADKISEKFDLPEDIEPITMFVIGRLGDGSDLPEDLKKQEDPDSDRKSHEKYLFTSCWKKPF